MTPQIEKIYKQVLTKKRNPAVSDWYNTDKGELYWYDSTQEWSCRDDKVSEEYPSIWYEEVSLPAHEGIVSEGEMAIKFANYIRDNKWQGFLLDSWIQLDGNGNQINAVETLKELFGIFKELIIPDLVNRDFERKTINLQTLCKIAGVPETVIHTFTNAEINEDDIKWAQKTIKAEKNLSPLIPESELGPGEIPKYVADYVNETKIEGNERAEIMVKRNLLLFYDYIKEDIEPLRKELLYARTEAAQLRAKLSKPAPKEFTLEDMYYLTTHIVHIFASHSYDISKTPKMITDEYLTSVK